MKDARAAPMPGQQTKHQRAQYKSLSGALPLRYGSGQADTLRSNTPIR
jgi:hypothetical protein